MEVRGDGLSIAMRDAELGMRTKHCGECSAKVPRYLAFPFQGQYKITHGDASRLGDTMVNTALAVQAVHKHLP